MIVFITGASAGFGQAIARTFVHGGHQVLPRPAKELEQRPAALELDVRDRAACRPASQLPAEFAAIDVLVNNAGLALGLSPPTRPRWTIGKP